MQPVTSTVHTIDIAPADLAAFVTAHLASLTAAGAVLLPVPRLAPQRPVRHAPGAHTVPAAAAVTPAAPPVAYIGWPVTAAMVQAFVAASVPGLPAKISVRLIEGNPAVVARVSYTA